jgi:hypothetical protein
LLIVQIAEAAGEVNEILGLGEGSQGNVEEMEVVSHGP